MVDCSLICLNNFYYEFIFNNKYVSDSIHLNLEHMRAGPKSQTLRDPVEFKESYAYFSLSWARAGTNWNPIGNSSSWPKPCSHMAINTWLSQNGQHVHPFTSPGGRGPSISSWALLVCFWFPLFGLWISPLLYWKLICTF